ncbi:MAG: cupin domain-containing protein [Alphaproteobacteria bacterium]|nr:cupin domain-containing protein [Alphaproteobacteria bacterium]
MRPTMCIRGELALLVLVVAYLAGAQSAYGGGGPDCDFDRKPTSPGPPLEAPFVFETVELSDGSGRRYAVRLAPCGEILCPIEVQLRDDDTVYDALAKGDSFSFPSHLPHRYTNPSADTETVVVWANTPITLGP